MLKILRHKKTAKRIFMFLAIVIVPAFVLWGSGSIVRDKMHGSYAGEIFGKKISFQTYRDALKAVQDQALIQFGDNFSKVRPFLDMDKLAWDRLIALHKAREEKIRISDKEVVKTIADYPFFQKDGLFNNQIYDQVLRYGLEITPKDFEAHIRQSLAINELFKRHAKDIKISDEELLNEYRKENEKVKVSFIAFKAQDFKNEVSLSEEEAKNYFDKHKTEFLTDPSINIEYIGADFSPKPTSDEKEKAKTLVSSIQDSAKKEKDWKALSLKHNLRHKITGYFFINDPIPAIGWSTQFYEAILPLKIDEVSPVIETEQGFFIARLLDIKQPQIPEFGQIKEKVIDKVKGEKASDLALAKADSTKRILEEKIASSNADFQKVAKELKLETKETDFFKQNQYLETIGISAQFTNAAFSLIDKPKALVVVNTPAASYVLKLVQFTPVDLKKFESEKKEFSQALRDKKSEQVLIEYLAKLRLQARLKSNIGKSKTASLD